MILDVYERLLNRFGHQHWWPAESKFEMIVGAILTQQTSWKNVEKAIKNLKNKSMLLPEIIDKLSLQELEKLIQPAGFYKVKAKRLKNFLRFLFDNYDGDLERLLQNPLEELRKELLSVNGIGKETADSIILYAAEKPIFVVDAYTFRLCKRFGISESKDYDRVRKIFENNLPKDINLFKEFHALIVELGKNYCRKKPRCEACPLNDDCAKCLGP